MVTKTGSTCPLVNQSCLRVRKRRVNRRKNSSNRSSNSKVEENEEEETLMNNDGDDDDGNYYDDCDDAEAKNVMIQPAVSSITPELQEASQTAKKHPTDMWRRPPPAASTLSRSRTLPNMLPSSYPLIKSPA